MYWVSVAISFSVLYYFTIRKRSDYNFTVLHALAIPVTALATHLISTRVLYFINYGSWGGHFFYGGVLFIPLFIIIPVFIFKMSYLRATDYCAPACVYMLIIGKLNCLSNGCCGGRDFVVSATDTTFTFPCQLAESLTALAMFLFLAWMVKNPKNRGMLYGWYYIIYGIQRIIFEQLREVKETPTILNLPVATFWCLVCVIIGVIWVIVVPQYKKTTRYSRYLEKETLIEQKENEKAKLNKIRKQKEKQAKQKIK